MTTPYSGTPDYASHDADPYATDAPRGTEGTAYGRVINADDYYNAPVAEPAPEPTEENKDTAVVDSRPVLEGVAPQFASADDEPEGVDMTTLPEFKDLRRMLPSERLKVQMSTAKVATGLPAHLKNAGRPV